MISEVVSLYDFRSTDTENLFYIDYVPHTEIFNFLFRSKEYISKHDIKRFEIVVNLGINHDLRHKRYLLWLDLFEYGTDFFVDTLGYLKYCPNRFCVGSSGVSDGAMINYLIDITSNGLRFNCNKVVSHRVKLSGKLYCQQCGNPFESNEINDFVLCSNCTSSHGFKFMTTSDYEKIKIENIDKGALGIVKSMDKLKMDNDVRIKENQKLYLINEVGTNLYKIGISSSPKSRLSSIQTGNPRELKMVFSKKIKDARSVETVLHRHFIDNTCRGEWYELDEKQVDFVKKYCSK